MVPFHNFEYVPPDPQYSTIDALAGNITADGRRPKTSSVSSIDQFLIEKLNCFDRILSSITFDEQSRNTLSLKIIGHIYLQYFYIASKLYGLPAIRMAGGDGKHHLSSSLEQRLDGLKREKRAELVGCWKDIAELRREARTWIKQREDLAQRVKLVLGQKYDPELPPPAKRPTNFLK